MRFRNSCFGMLNFSFQKNHWKIPLVSITPVGTSAVSARPSPSIICPCGPRMATTPSLAALAWYGWRAFWAELDPPNHQHEKKQTTKQPSLLILQTTVPNKKKQEITVLYSKQPSTLTPGWRTPEMPWSKDYKWLKTAWSLWGFIDPK